MIKSITVTAKTVYFINLKPLGVRLKVLPEGLLLYDTKVDIMNIPIKGIKIKVNNIAFLYKKILSREKIKSILYLIG